jgi:hypothetical protein
MWTYPNRTPRCRLEMATPGGRETSRWPGTPLPRLLPDRRRRDAARWSARGEARAYDLDLRGVPATMGGEEGQTTFGGIYYLKLVDYTALRSP